jgi:hypothetical protein
MDDSTAAEPTPRASLVPALLGAQAALLAAFGVACLAAGALGLGLACVLAAVVAAGLASSIHEGMPAVTSTVLGFEGAVVATALVTVSAGAALGAAAATGAALGWARRREASAQMRRPVPSQ